MDRYGAPYYDYSNQHHYNNSRLHYPHQLHTEVALPNYVQLEPHGGYGPGRYPPPASYGAQPRYPPPPPRHHNVPQPVLHQGPPVAYQNSRQHSSSGRGPSTSAKRSSSSQSMMPAPAKRPKLASGAPAVAAGFQLPADAQPCKGVAWQVRQFRRSVEKGDPVMLSHHSGAGRASLLIGSSPAADIVKGSCCSQHCVIVFRTGDRPAGARLPAGSVDGVWPFVTLVDKKCSATMDGQQLVAGVYTPMKHGSVLRMGEGSTFFKVYCEGVEG